MAFFESLGVPLKTERGGRVFPKSDRASDIAGALMANLEKAGASVKRCAVTAVVAQGGESTSVLYDGGAIECRAAILATGGVSYSSTGSTGDGYAIAAALGHTITPLRGSLVPLEASPEMCSRMQGLTLKNVRLYVYDGGKKPVFEGFGELLFTHFGISGPLTLSASAHMRDFDNKRYHVIVDLKPALSEEKLDQRVLRDFSKYSNRVFSNALGDLLSRMMVPVVVEKSGIMPGVKVHSVTREERLSLVRLIKAFRIDISGPANIDEAIITSGGVDLREIDPRTMESKLVRGLFFAGEIIDADAYTGGYNLQIAWSTAYAAAKAASQAAAGCR